MNIARSRATASAGMLLLVVILTASVAVKSIVVVAPCSTSAISFEGIKHGPSARGGSRREKRSRNSMSSSMSMTGSEQPNDTPRERYDFLTGAAGGIATLVTTAAALAARPSAGTAAASTAAPTQDEFVNFTDSRGLFSCRLPANFIRSERKNDKKGTLFVAGDFQKAEVISVQKVSSSDLLADAGLPTIGDLSKWESLGNAKTVAKFLKQRRDSDAAGSSASESVVLPNVSLNGDVLQFAMKSPIKVMRADLLQEQQGVSELYRNTYVKAIMRGDGTFLVVWAGALNTDWDGEGGAQERLKVAVDSFKLEGLVVEGVRLGAA